MARARREAGVAAILLIAAAACGGGGERPSLLDVDESKPFLQADGPLLAPVLVGVGPEGRFRDPTAGFTPADTEVNAFVGVGAGVEDEATLVVNWYRGTGAESREHLFSHQIEVGAHGVARSQGLARTGLTPGIYEVVASLGDLQVRTPWVVTEAAAVERTLSSAGSAAEASPATPEPGVSDFDDWGDESWDQPSEPASPASRDDGPCGFGDLDLRTTVLVRVGASWSGQCATITLAATVTGPPEPLVTIDAPELRNDVGVLQHSAAVESDPCALPGGSDLPGTVVRGVATDSGGATRAGEATLEDLGEALQAGIDTVPERGSRVEAGDTIRIEALALLFAPALGVRVLYVNANDDLVESVGNLSGSSEPRSCDKRRLIAHARTQYRVPRDAPAVIDICANAVGFDGTEANECAPFYTGEVWEGTIESVVTAVPATGVGPCGSQTRLVGTARLVVASDGSVSGQYDVEGCGVSEPHAEFTGTATESAFSFPQLIVFTNGQPVPKTSATEARATLTNFQGAGGVGARWVTTWTLTCESC